MKIVSVVGARPEFVQIACLSRELRKRHEEILVHTGQHHDDAMSGAFFRTLDLPTPDHDLNVGSVPAAEQVGLVTIRLAALLEGIRPDCVVVRGDTNSTLGAAIAAVKAGCRLVHVEAGERSGDMTMPEEINRLAVDRIARAHFCASRTAVRRLATEGIATDVHWVGDVMLDAMNAFLPAARGTSRVLETLGLTPGTYALMTLHRQENVDRPERLRRLIDGVNRAPGAVVFPLHPRTRARLQAAGLSLATHVRAIDPVDYFDMLALESGARLIATDSGGVQREAYFLKVPCLTLRDATEWTETIQAGWNRLVPADPDAIVSAWANPPAGATHPPIFGEGFASRNIAHILSEGIV